MSIRAALHALARGDQPALPTMPWLVWLAVCWCRHRHRLDWAQDLVPRLDQDPEPQTVPGHPDWTSTFDDEGFELIGPAGEHLWVNAYEPTTVNPWSITQRCASLDPCPLPEARVRRWLPDRALVQAAFEELREEGFVPETNSLHAELVAIDFDDASLASRWLEQLREDDDGTRRAHRDWLLQLGASSPTYETLGGLAQVLETEDLRALCESTLRGPVTADCGKALEILHGLGDDRSAPAVRRFFARARSKEHHPFAPWEAARYLLARGIDRDQVLAKAHRFARVTKVKGYGGNPFDDQWALLLLEHDSENALEAVRRGLRSRTPAAATRLAFVLALLDAPWCRRELIEALRQDEDTTRSRRLAAALRLSRDTASRRIGEEFTPLAPERAPDAVGYTHDEVVHANLDAETRSQAERQRPVADRLRSILPNDLFD